MPYKRKYKEEDWRRVVELSESGDGSYRIANRLGIPRDTVKRWIGLYRREGHLGWAPVTTRQSYSFETKLAAVRAFFHGSTKPSILAQFNIRNKTQLDDWIVA